MNGKFLTLALMAVASFAAESGSHIQQQLTGSEIKTTSGEVTDNKPKYNNVYNYNEVVYEHMKNRQTIPQTTQEGVRVAFGDDNKQRKADEIAKKINLAAQEKQNKEAAKSVNKFAEGYCYVKYDTEVEKIATYAYLSCDFSAPLGKAELVVSLVPDFYAKALVAKPLYLNVMNKSHQKTRIPISSGAVLTQNKLSINVANIVNDYKLEKLIASGTYSSLNAATTQSQLYLTDLRASRVKQETQNSSSISGMTTTTTTNTEKPVASDYLLTGGLQIVTELTKLVGEAMVSSYPYTFKIKKDSILYADIELSDEQMLRGFDPALPNIIKKQPSYNISKGKEDEQEITAVPVRTGGGQK